jgi:hypothetical protein
MDNIRRLGGSAGILAGMAAAWLLVGMTMIFPASGLGLNVMDNPNKYLPFVAKHPVTFWMVNVLGGLLTPLLALVLLLALADRFKEDAPDRAQIGLAIGVVGVTGFAVGAFLKLIGLGSLATLYQTSKQSAAIAFHAVNGTAGSFMALGDVSLGLAALIFGSMMLGTRGYGQVGYLGVVAGTPLILSGFVSHIILFLIASVLSMAWLTWTGVVLQAETAPRRGDTKVALGGHLKVFNRGHGARRAV